MDAVESIFKSVFYLFRSLHIPATWSHIKKTLASHPDFPGVYAIIESLSEWGVEAVGLSGTIENLKTVEFPCIAQFDSDFYGLEEYHLIEKISDTHVFLIHSKKRSKKITLEEFSEKWTGVIIKITERKGKGEYNFHLNRNKEILASIKKNTPFLLISILFFSICIYAYKDTFFPGLFLCLGFLKLFGLFLSILLLIPSLSPNNVLPKLCPSGKVVNCHQVIHSKGGKIFGIPMSDLGLMYFAGGLVTLILSSGTNSAHFVFLIIMNFFALPYTIFSIYYQAFVLHTWCLICIIIQVIFWLEFIASLRLFDFVHEFRNAEFTLPVIFGFGLTVFIWAILRDLISGSLHWRSCRTEIIRMKRHPLYIKALLGSQRKVSPVDFPNEIVFGSREAKNRFVILVDPNCFHCRSIVKEMESFYESKRIDAKFIVRFFISPISVNESGPSLHFQKEVALRIIALAVKNDFEMMNSALKEWFSLKYNELEKSFSKWEKKYQIENKRVTDKASIILNLHEEWAKKMNIAVPPAVFLNGKKLPYQLDISDLIHYLKRLK